MTVDFIETQRNTNGKFNPGTIKKNIGVWEFGIGFTYKFPTFR